MPVRASYSATTRSVASPSPLRSTAPWSASGTMNAIVDPWIGGIEARRSCASGRESDVASSSPCARRARGGRGRARRRRRSSPCPARRKPRSRRRRCASPRSRRTPSRRTASAPRDPGCAGWPTARSTRAARGRPSRRRPSSRCPCPARLRTRRTRTDRRCRHDLRRARRGQPQVRDRVRRAVVRMDDRVPHVAVAVEVDALEVLDHGEQCAAASDGAVGHREAAVHRRGLSDVPGVDDRVGLVPVAVEIGRLAALGHADEQVIAGGRHVDGGSATRRFVTEPVTRSSTWRLRRSRLRRRSGPSRPVRTRLERGRTHRRSPSIGSRLKCTATAIPVDVASRWTCS